MRPSSKPTGAVWRLLEAWSSQHDFRPNQSQMARIFGVSTSLITDWKYMQSVMQVDDMQVVATKTGIDFALIARAVADDRKEAEERARSYAATSEPGSEDPGNVTPMPRRPSAPANARAARKGVSRGKEDRKKADAAGEEEQVDPNEEGGA